MPFDNLISVFPIMASFCTKITDMEWILLLLDHVQWSAGVNSGSWSRTMPSRSNIKKNTWQRDHWACTFSLICKKFCTGVLCCTKSILYSVRCVSQQVISLPREGCMHIKINSKSPSPEINTPTNNRANLAAVTNQVSISHCTIPNSLLGLRSNHVVENQSATEACVPFHVRIARSLN